MTTKEEVSMPKVPDWVNDHNTDCVLVDGEWNRNPWCDQEARSIGREAAADYPFRLIPVRSFGADPIIVGLNLGSLLFWWAEQQARQRAWWADEFHLVSPHGVARVGFSHSDNGSLASLWISTESVDERSAFNRAMHQVADMTLECFGPKRVTFEF